MTDPIDRPYFPASDPGAQQEGVDAPGFFSATSVRRATRSTNACRLKGGARNSRTPARIVSVTV